MYVSLLGIGKLHRARSGAYGFGPPSSEDPLRLLPTWSYMLEFLDGSETGPKSIQQLFNALKAPPYGLKEGPLPVILLALLKHLGNEVALFEEGTFIPELTEPVIERLIRSCERFSIERFQATREREAVLKRISQLLPESGGTAPVAVVSALCKRIAQLTPYARQTTRLEPMALAVRKVVLDARDPLRLVFVDLPIAVGIDPGQLGSRVGVFSERLGSALESLAGAFSGLLYRARDALAAAFDLGADASGMRDELTRRARDQGSLEPPELRSFVLRAADATLEHAQWFESILTVLVGKPPGHWLDGDEARFEQRLRDVAGVFRRAEELAFDARKAEGGDGGLVEVLRVSVATPLQGESRRLVRVRPQDREHALMAEKSLEALVTSLCGERRDLALAVVGRLFKRLISRADDGTIRADSK